MRSWIGSDDEGQRPDKYPVIDVDANIVIARRLAGYYNPEDSSRGNTEIDETLFTLMYDIRTFAEAALRARNSNGAALAVIRLREHAEFARRARNEGQLNYTVNSLLDIGVLRHRSETTLPTTELASQAGGIAAMVREALIEYAEPAKLVKEAREVLLKYSPEVDYATATAYVAEVGRALRVDWDGPGLYTRTPP